MPKSVSTFRELEKAAAAYVESIADTAGLLWTRGWAESGAGNMSYDLRDALDLRGPLLRKRPQLPLPMNGTALQHAVLLVTAAGSRMRDIAADPLRHLMVLAVDEHGTACRLVPLGGGDIRPTSELATHCAVHNLLRERRSPHRVIVHTHPTELIALMHARACRRESRINAVLFSMYPEAAIAVPEGVGLVPYILTGSDTLAAETLRRLETTPVVLWEKHGCLAVGGDPQSAFDRIDVMNKAAQMYLMCRSAGYRPSGLSAGQIEELRSKFSSLKM